MSLINGNGVNAGSKFDFSAATVTSEDLPYGVTAWDGSGNLITGPWSNPYLSGDIVLGGVVTFAEKSWRVQHIDGKYAYLAFNGIAFMCVFESSNSNVYATSGILNNTCKGYETTLGSEAMSYCQEVTVNGGTSKVFIPSQAQYQNEWDWPKASDNRRKQTGGNFNVYWTSTPLSISASNVMNVTAKGTFESTEANYVYGGFRPAVKVQFKA